MAQFDITAPDGRQFRVTAPDGATEREVYEYASKHWERRKGIEADTKREMAQFANPTGSFGENFAAGMGKAGYDLARGAAQMVGAGPSAEETREMRRRDAPLMGSGGGISGYIGGNLLPLAMVGAVPGANTVVGAGVIGSTAAALQPAVSPQERLLNQGLGFGLGAGSQFVGTTVATHLGERQAARLAAQSRNATRDATLAEAQREGFKVPASSVNPTFLTNRLESVSGKAATAQALTLENQQVANDLARRVGRFGPDEALSKSGIEQKLKVEAEPYREVAALAASTPLSKPPFKSPAATLQELKEVRKEANTYWRHYDIQGDPKSLKEAQRLSTRAEQLEQQIESVATALGKPDLVERLRASRSQIAKLHDIDRALNYATGDVSMPILGRMFDKDAGRMTGELATAAKFQQAFPAYAREAASIQAPGVSKIEPLAASLLASSGASAAGHPAGLLAGGLPLLSGPARSLVTSAPFQGAFARPNYSGGVMQMDPETIRLLSRGLGPAAGLPLLSQ